MGSESPAATVSLWRKAATQRRRTDATKSSARDDGWQPGGQEAVGGYAAGWTAAALRALSRVVQQMDKPAWMEDVNPADMTGATMRASCLCTVSPQADEQKVAVAAYQKRLATLRAERETRRKLLETELSKVYCDEHRPASFASTPSCSCATTWLI